jgi:hypothetical protein
MTDKGGDTDVKSPAVESPPVADLPEYPAARHPTRRPAPQAGFGFNGTVSGFPTGEVFLTGGGAYGLATDFVHSAGGFSCLEDVLQGPLSMSINPDDPGPCLAGEGVRWDTAALLASTTFKCTGAMAESLKTATTSNTTVVLQADFYRAGDGIDESFTAQMIVSATDIAPDIQGLQNLWVQGVGCGTAIVHFSNKPYASPSGAFLARPVDLLD